MKKILILGGTGFVGRHLCEKLAEGDYRTTVLTRRRTNARHLQMLPMLDVVEGSAYDAATLSALLAEHDAVVNLVAILHGTEAAFDCFALDDTGKIDGTIVASAKEFQFAWPIRDEQDESGESRAKTNRDLINAQLSRPPR